VDIEQAKGRVIEGRHTIWEIVNHLIFGTDAVIDAINGEAMPLRKSDWPPMGDGDADWIKDQDRLIRSLDRLIEAIKEFERDRFHEDVPGDHYPYTYLQMFFRAAYHNVHHLGQIAILRAKQ